MISTPTVPVTHRHAARSSTPDLNGCQASDLAEAEGFEPPTRYQLQAAIAALHDGASRAEATDWRQILALYTLLLRFNDGPLIRLSRVVALAMVHGPRTGLAEITSLEDDPHLARHHRLAAVRAHLLELVGDTPGARAAYEQAARTTLSTPERRHLQQRAARLSQ